MGGPPATRGVALAAAPCNAPHRSRFVRLRSRRPRPPNGCARWLPEVAIAPPWSPGGPLAPGRQAPSYDAPQGRVSSASAQPALTRPGSRCPWQVARSVRARYGFRCTESSCPPAAGRRTAPRSLPPIISWDSCCVPAQAFSPLARSGSPTTCAQVPRTPSSPSLSRAA